MSARHRAQGPRDRGRGDPRAHPPPRRELRPRGGDPPRLRRPRGRHRDGQERVHRPEDLGDPGLHRQPLALPPPRRGDPRRPRPDREGRRAARGLEQRRHRGDPGPRGLGQAAGGADRGPHRQPPLAPRPGRRRAPRRLDPRRGLPPGPRPHRLDDRRPRHGRRAQHGPARAARLHRRGLRGAPPRGAPRQEAPPGRGPHAHRRRDPPRAAGDADEGRAVRDDPQAPRAHHGRPRRTGRSSA